MHSFDERVYRFVGTLRPLIKGADIFATEVTMDMMDMSKMSSLLPLIIMKGDTTLSMLYDSNEYSRISRYITDSVGIPMMFIAKIKPFYVMGLMMMDEIKRDAGTFLDDSLSRIAGEYNRERIGLETVEDQANAVDAISLHEQAKMLLDAVDSAYALGSGSETDAMTDAYQSGDLDKLWELYQQESVSSTFDKALLKKRNAYMAERIDEVIKSGKSIFAAVGALHLAGTGGVIDLLRKKGYTVIPISLQK
jgi:uncharacterized protein YbaP (TraB family)